MQDIQNRSPVNEQRVSDHAHTFRLNPNLKLALGAYKLSNLFSRVQKRGVELSIDTNVSAFWAHLSHHSPDVDRLRAATKSPEVRNQEAGTHSVSHRSSTNVYQSPHQFSAKLHKTPISFKPGREQNAERDQPSDVLNSATPGPLMGIEKKTRIP